MTIEKTVFVIDAGNTVIKTAVFVNDELTEIQRFKSSDHTVLIKMLQEYKEPFCVISSVLSKESTDQVLSYFEKSLLVNHDTPLPISFNYKTPHTLGIDRICNAVALYHLSPGHQSVCIDIGTCIKFDFIDGKGQYQGGSISPGIQLRYASLNDYTANLPLINETSSTSLIGQSTIESMHSGVINGIQGELDQFILRYQEEQGDLTFFVTGGDSQHFDFPRKNNIFVDENLTLKGLYQIYLFNAQ